MKKLYLAIFLLTLCIGLCIFEQVTISNVYAHIITQIDSTVKTLDTGNYDEAEKSCRELTEYWNKKYPYLSAMIDHDTLDNAGASIKSLNDLASEKSQNLEETLIEAKNEVEVIKNNQTITFGNIF